MNKRLSLWFCVLAIAAGVIAAYGGTLRNGFVYDDYNVVAENLTIRDWRNFPHLFDASYFHRARELSYRPVVTVSYFIDYSLWKRNPAGFHLTNVAWHSLNSVLFFFLLARILGRRGIALAAALLFAVHPVISEAVNGVGFREDLIAAGFVLAAFIFYLRASATPAGRWRWYAGCWTAFALALFAKENALILPFLCLLHEFCFSRRFSRSVKDNSAVYAGMIAVAAVYLPIRFLIMVQTRALAFYPPVFYQRMLTMSKVFFRYLGLMIYPERLSAEYQYPVSVSILEPRVLAALAGIAVILVFVARAARRRQDVFFAAGWFFLALAPVANVIPLYNFVAERYLYFPAMGFFAAVAIVAGHLIDRLRGPARRPAAAIILTTALVLYGARTIVRNRDWRDHVTFLKKTIETCPDSAKFHNNLGYMYEQAGRLDEAERELRIALKLDPEDESAHHNLGSVCDKKGRLEEAIQEYRTALKRDPKMVGTHHNLGLVYGKQGKIDEAMAEFRTALQLDPDFPKSHFNLGFCYQNQGQLDKAIAEYKIALSLDPDDVKSHFYLGTAYHVKGELEKAVKEYETAVKLDPRYIKGYIRLTEIFFGKGETGKAGIYWDKARALEPSFPEMKEYFKPPEEAAPAARPEPAAGGAPETRQ